MTHDPILEKIKAENVKPISRYVFLFRKIIIWFLLAISTMFGAYAFAFFFLKTLYIDFDNWHYFANSYDRFLMQNIPVIWVMLFAVSLCMMFFLFKRTNRGYKYSIVFVGFLSIALSFILGLALAKVLSQRGILIEQFERERVMDWTNPKAGRLSGAVLFVDDEYMMLRDIQDDIWNVDTSHILDNSKDALENNDFVSIIGRYDYENNFTACQIIPLHMDRMRFRPDPKNRPGMRQEGGNTLASDICDFVINAN
jgi:hypothetical protein